MKTKHTIIRDISWLAFNERVLQEAMDEQVHLYDRLKFLGIFSNNLDEFFRVRVATLTKMKTISAFNKFHAEAHPEKILKKIHDKVLEQQRIFDKTFTNIIELLEKKHRIYFKNERKLNAAQKVFVKNYFEDQVRSRIVPLMIESMPHTPFLRDKHIYLACVLGNDAHTNLQSYALIDIPSKTLPRFVILPDSKKEVHVILLEDIIRFNLSNLFAPFGYNQFSSHIVKLTRDAEIELDHDFQSNVVEELEKGLKSRKKGKATRFVYDKQIDARLLDFLIKRLNLSKKDNLIAGGRIHNFKDFMDFPKSVFSNYTERPKPFIHPLLTQPCRIMSVLDQRDVMLHLPYHSFDSVIDLLREAAIDPFVQSIKITCYRLAKDSKVINALLNAVRNGKEVTVVLELRARFDEEANLHWKTVLEEEGVKVLIGMPNMKVHAKLCVIKKKQFNRIKYYGFISTGNFNESTSKVYGDHLLFTSHSQILRDANAVFTYLEKPLLKKNPLDAMKILIATPKQMRPYFLNLIQQEIKQHKSTKQGQMIVKLNSLVDEVLIEKLYDAAKDGVPVHLIIRGICCAITELSAFKKPIHALSIVDQYLEHARVFIFGTGKNAKTFISSADWMVRNLDHRIEVACPILDPLIAEELQDILTIQLQENVKGRILDNEQMNTYVLPAPKAKKLRSQTETFNYLSNKKYN